MRKIVIVDGMPRISTVLRPVSEPLQPKVERLEARVAELEAALEASPPDTETQVSDEGDGSA